MEHMCPYLAARLAEQIAAAAECQLGVTGLPPHEVEEEASCCPHELQDSKGAAAARVSRELQRSQSMDSNRSECSPLPDGASASADSSLAGSASSSARSSVADLVASVGSVSLSSDGEPAVLVVPGQGSAPAYTGGSQQQQWRMFRPKLDHDPVLRRRELRRRDGTFTLSEVSCHRYQDDCWIAVDGKVYDITQHVVDHPGWDNAGISTVLSILAHAGTECSPEFHQIHKPYPVAYKQLAAFYIGDLVP